MTRISAMKKLSVIICSALAVAACSKSNVTEQGSLISIPVTVESIATSTKASIVVDGSKFTPSITDGDKFKMMVNDESTNMTDYKYSEATNSISGNLPAAKDASTVVRYMVVSNSDAGGAGSAAAYCRFKIDDKQTNDNGEFGRNLMLVGFTDEVAVGDKPGTIDFKTMCTLLEFDVENGVEDKTYLDSIKIEAVGGEQIAGRFAVSKTYTEDWMNTYSVDPKIKDENKSSSVTLDCKNTEITGTSAPYYIACAFGILSQGLKVSFFVNHGDGFQSVIEKTIGKSGLTLARNTLYQIPTAISDKIIVRPVVSLSTTEFPDVSYEGDVLSLNYTISNPVEGESISVSSDASWVNSFDYSVDGEISFVVDANDGVARTATLTVSYKDAADVTFTVSQARKAGVYTVTYTVASTTSLTTSGTAPSGSSATFKNTYTTKEQMISGKSQTYTLSGYKGYTIKKVVLSMKSNSKAGAGTFSLKAGDKTLAEINSATTFNKWFDNTAYSTTYKDVTVKLTNENYQIQTGENVVLVIAATTNSLYCQSITITYE